MGIRYVSFDIYDTLICRIFSQSELYHMIESKIKMDGTWYWKGFADKRIAAEIEVQKNIKNYSLEEIYNASTFSDLDDSEKEYLQKLEQEYEIYNAIASPIGLKLYKEYQNHYPIVCISDMYLNRDVLKRILEKNGYFDVAKIYVSCEANASKLDISLFSKVIDDLKICPSELLHIGDAVRSDYINPKLYKVKSKHCRRFKNLVDTGDYFHDLGVNIFGPIIYGFCQWLHSEGQGHHKLFLAREGITLRKFYGTLFPDEETQILYVSRKSVANGLSYILLQKQSFADFLKSMSMKRNETVGELFKRLELDWNRYAFSLERYGLSYKDFVASNQKLLQFLEDNREHVLEEMHSGYLSFSEYLNYYQLNGSCLIDVGWRGTMQDMLECYLKAIGEDNEMYGLYIGVTNQRNRKGYLFNKNDLAAQNMFCFSGLLEVLLQPDMGSVVGYRRSMDGIVPVCAESEFPKEELEIIHRVQKGIMDFIETCIPFGNCQYDGCTYKQKLYRLGLYPSQCDIRKLGNLSFFENEQITQLVENVNLDSLSTMKKKFIESRWKTAFLKNIFKVDLPYYRAINLIRSKMDK